ncbi:hypothetical protein CYMTET_48356 [Cymbomonas tetramitiformis]|nr:hypothetical protein CYMTET_48356 [Cymbomonas tetramitiformis]
MSAIIGGDSAVIKGNLKGRLSEVGLWNRPLTPVQVSEIASREDFQYRESEGGIVAYFALEEGAGTIVRDVSACGPAIRQGAFFFFS